MNAVLKQILPIFVKNVSFLEEIKEQYLQSLLMYSYILLFNEKIGFDLRMKVCLIFVYSFSVLEGDNMSVSQLISKNGSQFNLSVNSLDGKSIPNDYLIIIYSSILNVLPEDKLISEKVDDKSLICVLCEGILETAKSNAGYSSVIIETGRALCHIVKHLKKIPLEVLKPLYVEGLFFVWSHADHFVDTVRTYAKQFFEDLVVLAAHHRESGNDELTELLLDKMGEIPDSSTVKFFAYEYLGKHYGCDYLLTKFENLPEVLLSFVDEMSVNEQVCKTYVALVEGSFDSGTKESWAKWVFPAMELLKSGKECHGFCQKIVNAAFKLQPAILRIIFPNEYVGSTQESTILLHCLHYARKNGIELSVDKETNLYWRGLIDKQKMEMFMIHQDEEIRLLVLGCVAESLKTTELYLDWEFIFLINYIRYNITAQTPNVRKQIVAYYKKVLARFDAGYKVILRNIAHLNRCLESYRLAVEKDKSLAKNPADNATVRFLNLYQELKKSYRCFICNLTKILIGNLSYDSNYPRRASSLELLLVIRTVLAPDEWKKCWSEDDVKNSHNILFDTYESNKKMIVALLKSLPPHYLGFTNVNFTYKYMQRCFEMALEVKPSKTLSAAYLFEICAYSPYFYTIVHCDESKEGRKSTDPILDMIVVVTRKLMNHASDLKIDGGDVSKSSIYGLILSIRHLLESRSVDEQHHETYAGIFDHLIVTCFDIQTKIMPVVCNPSPEGYLPENGDDVCETDESSRAQMILVYAWRTVKEITLLLAEIAKQTVNAERRVGEEDATLVVDEKLTKIGEFFVDVFVQSKHRGVFEQGYVGFSVVCESFWRSSRKTISCLPKKWLHEALDLCTGKTQSDGLCPTRRSAGLPFLILSILTNEPDPSYFHDAMETLLARAEDYETCSNETRMHCMNVLRAIYRHSKLGELVASYVARGVILAITGYKSDDWAIRNSSTLLYATLMTRMFGVQRTADSEDLCIKNKLTLRVFFLRYPELYGFLLDTLAQECRNRSSLVLHPVLMILARLYGSNFEDNRVQMDQYFPYVNVCLSNPVYRTRDLAAKASLSLVDYVRVLEHFSKCFGRLQEADVTDNECHGILLQVWHILKSQAVSAVDFPLGDYLSRSVHLWDQAGRKFSHMTVNLYTEVVARFLLENPDFADVHWLKRILLGLSRQIKRNALPETWRNKFAATRFVLTYYIVINKLEETDVTYSTMTNEIMSYLYGHDPYMKRFCLHFLISLNQTLQAAIDPDFKEHPLFRTEDVEIPAEVTGLISTFQRSSGEKILRQIHPYLKPFLMEELKIEHYVRNDDKVLLFLLLDFYPCAIRFLRLSKQETLNTLLAYCDCDNEELISAAISTVSTFMAEVDYNLLCYDKLIEVLSKSASPAATVHRRLAVCEFLCRNYILYCNEEPILKGDLLCTALNMVMVLLEDDELEVRNSMSNYENALKVRIKINNSMNQTISGQRWPVVPEKAKEDLIYLATVLLPQDKAVCLIFSWACRYFPDPSNEAFEIFERGGLNQYAENTPLIDVCSRILIKMLWSLPEGLSYEDKSIFLEEQTLTVTTVLLNALLRYDSPMMLLKTKLSVICALKSMYKFLENIEVGPNFASAFRTYLNDTILNYLTTHLEHSDLFCVKKIIRKLYDPVFRPRR
ncbi:tRNA (32-2'-O)-methyltransferase regulator THADA isoform X2 [Cylas formicarius]|nr:tRNA (32-2'-O)-methyltransferase regulator THADA isoform X2 [Cylas formicarius]